MQARGGVPTNPDVEGSCPCCAGLASLARVQNPDRREESHVGARVPTTPARVVLLAEEESQLQVTSYKLQASSVWNPYKQKHIEAIEDVQKRATRQLPNMSKLSYEERLRKLNLPTLTYRYGGPERTWCKYILSRYIAT